MCVLGMNFGTLPGYSFSWKSDWTAVLTFQTIKSTALLFRHKVFKAFDYGAEFIFMDHIHVVESLPDLYSGSDSDSQEEAEHVKKNKFRERYYFPGSNTFLLNENVSLLVFF